MTRTAAFLNITLFLAALKSIILTSNSLARGSNRSDQIMQKADGR